MVTVEQKLDRPSNSVFVWARVAGIPFLLGSGETPLGMQQEAGGKFNMGVAGENYDWVHGCLLLPPGFGATEALAQPKGGLPETGDLSLTLRSPGLGTSEFKRLIDLGISSTEKVGGVVGNLNVELAAAGEFTIQFLQNPWYYAGSEPTVLYAGQETIILGEGPDSEPYFVSTTELGYITHRGAFGSNPRQHFARASSGAETYPSGMMIADYPLLWEGRLVEIFVTFGQHIPGRGFVCDGEDEGEDIFAEPHTFCFWAGLTKQVKKGGDFCTILMHCAGLGAYFQGPVLARTPEGSAGMGREKISAGGGLIHYVYLDSHNYWLHCVIRGNTFRAMQLMLVVKDNSAAGSGNTLVFGPVTLTAGTDFSIGATAIDTAENIRVACLASASWRLVFEMLSGPYDGGTLAFRAQQGLAATAMGLTTNNSSAFAFSQNNTTPVLGLNALNQRLRHPSTYAFVDPGRYHVSDIASFIGATLTYFMQAEGVNVDWEMQAFINPLHDPPVNGDYRGQPLNKYQLSIRPFPAANTTDWTLDLFTRYGTRESVVRDLGFTENQYQANPLYGPEYSQENGSFFDITASKKPAFFRWPTYGYPAPPRLYLHRFPTQWARETWSNQSDHFSGFDSDGGPIVVPAALLIEGVEVCTYDDDSETGGLQEDDGGFYLKILDRSLHNTGGEEYYIENVSEDEDKEQKLTRVSRVIAFGNCQLTTMLLQLLMGGLGISGYGGVDYIVGWAGCGLEIPPRLMDIATFERIASEGYAPRNGWVITDKTKIDELLDTECVLAQIQVVGDGGQFYAIQTLPPFESDFGDFFEITPDNCVTDPENDAPLGYDDDPGRIVNQVFAQVDWDVAAGEFGSDVKAYRQESITTWGAKDPINLKVYGLRGAVNAGAMVFQVGARIFGRFSRPYVVAEQCLSTPRAWRLRIGDPVLYTHPAIPKPNEAALGVEQLPCVIYGISKVLVAQSYFARVTLVCRAKSGQRFARWAPAANAWDADYVGVGNYTELKLYDYDYSLESRAVRDGEHFQVGWLVRVCRLYRVSEGTDATITAFHDAGGLDGYRMRLSGDITAAIGTGPWLVTFALYPDGADAQRKFVHFAAGPGQHLANLDGAVPFSYP